LEYLAEVPDTDGEGELGRASKVVKGERDAHGKHDDPQEDGVEIAGEGEISNLRVVQNKGAWSNLGTGVFGD
jgi:hypothetical protein